MHFPEQYAEYIDDSSDESTTEVLSRRKTSISQQKHASTTRTIRKAESEEFDEKVEKWKIER